MPQVHFNQVQIGVRSDRWSILNDSINDLVRRRPCVVPPAPPTHPLPTRYAYRDGGVCVVPIYRVIATEPRDAAFQRLLLGPQHGDESVLTSSACEPWIKLYKVGEQYFVRDGNRYVAAANSRGQLFLRAHVIEYLFDAAAQTYDLRQMLLEHERAAFFDRFRFPTAHPAYTMISSVLGGYEHLGIHLLAYADACGRVETSELWVEWYQQLYTPIMQLAERHNLLHALPGQSDIDLFLWAVKYQDQATTPLSCPSYGQNRVLALCESIGNCF